MGNGPSMQTHVGRFKALLSVEKVAGGGVGVCGQDDQDAFDAQSEKPDKPAKSAVSDWPTQVKDVL